MNHTRRRWSHFFLVALLICAFSLASTMPLLANSQQSGQSNSQQSAPQQSNVQPANMQQPDPSQSTDQNNATPDAPTTQKTSDALPDAPQAQSEQTQSQTPAQAQDQQNNQAPSGAAGAKAAPVKGAPVAQPTGAAVAPVRPKGHRSLLIKVGLIVGAAAAVGAVVALSERSPTRPPGTTSAAQQ